MNRLAAAFKRRWEAGRYCFSSTFDYSGAAFPARYRI
ncbi:hypothetical protein NIASO_14430 [Niabella soli DSM 19437]|uniref:Uncharacterized protein n=1 Tax=Niabella soli DSM 19437 TaxID=929713 RepID=W0F474_9BACT|nr:hypothetical protein NIASO_14430 [Niabella soli DSM 19437]